MPFVLRIASPYTTSYDQGIFPAEEHVVAAVKVALMEMEVQACKAKHKDEEAIGLFYLTKSANTIAEISNVFIHWCKRLKDQSVRPKLSIINTDNEPPRAGIV